MAEARSGAEGEEAAGDIERVASSMSNLWNQHLAAWTLPAYGTGVSRDATLTAAWRHQLPEATCPIKAGEHGDLLAKQIKLTVRPYLSRPFGESRVLDVGSGYGFTAVGLGYRCREVVALEPHPERANYSRRLIGETNMANVKVQQGTLEYFPERQTFDVAVVNNVLGYVSNPQRALERISRCLRPGGVAFLMIPNRLWPMEQQYHLPFLSYLPRSLGGLYLRLAGKALDYSQGNRGATYLGLRHMFRRHQELALHVTSLATVSKNRRRSATKTPWETLSARIPALTTLSKSLIAVAVKGGQDESARKFASPAKD